MVQARKDVLHSHYFLVVTASGIFMALSSAAKHSYFE